MIHPKLNRIPLTIIALVYVLVSIATATTSQAQALRLMGKFTGTSSTTAAASAATDTLRLSTTLRSFQQELTLESSQDSVTDLRISITPFTTPNGSQSIPSWTVNKQSGTAKTTVAATEAAILSLSLTTPVEGRYKSIVSLIYARKRWSIPIVITRTRLEPSLDIPELTAVRSWAVGPGKVQMRLTITEKAGQEVRLFKPVLSSMVSVQADKNKVQARYDSFLVYDERGDPLESIITIAPNQSKNFQLVVKGLRQPGEFTGSLLMAGPEVSTISRTFTIYQKERGGLAGLLIALGVVGSYVLRRYAKTGRPRLLRQHRAALLTTELNEATRINQDLSTEELSILQTLRRQINDVYEDTDLLTDDQANAVITAVDRKIDLFPKWGTARRAVDALQPPDLRKPFIPTLMEAKRLLQTPSLTEQDLTSLTATMTKIDQMPDEVNAASKNYLSDQLKRFLDDVDLKKKDITDPTVHQQLIDLVEIKLVKAQKLLDGDTADAIENVRNLYKEARIAYARLLTDVLIHSLSPTAPTGFTDADWTTFKQALSTNADNVKQATDADQAYKAYEDLYVLYLANLTKKLTDYREKTVGQLAKLGLDKKKEQPLAEKLEAAGKILETISGKITEKKFGEAGKAYNEAKNLIVDVADAVKAAKGGTLAAGAAPTPPTKPAEAATGSDSTEFYDMPFWNTILGPGRHRHLSATTLGQKIGWYDLVFTLIVLLVGVLSGLLLLWVNNATWGGFSDHLTAFLWGLGLHQVANNTAEGVVGWAAKLTK